MLELCNSVCMCRQVLEKGSSSFAQLCMSIALNFVREREREREQSCVVEFVVCLYVSKILSVLSVFDKDIQCLLSSAHHGFF